MNEIEEAIIRTFIIPSRPPFTTTITHEDCWEDT
jgi:hypothetical protein